MSETPKRRQVQIASFSVDDVSQTHRGAMFGGAALMVVAALLGAVSAANLRAVSDAKGAARQLYSASQLTLQGTQSYAGGGASRLGVALAQAPLMASAFNDLRDSANSMLVLPGVKSSAGNAYGAWSALSGALGAIGPQVEAVADLSDAMGKSLASLNAVVTKLEPVRQSQQYARAYDVAVRLYTYSEAGFGLASLPRVDSELQSLGSELAATELKPDVAFLAPLVAQARAADAKATDREQLVGLFNAAGIAKSSADSLNQVMEQQSTPAYLGVGALLAAAAGLICMLWSLKVITTDFGKRFAKSLSQFRGAEHAQKELVVSLRAAAAGDIYSAVSISSRTGELSDVVEAVNDLLGWTRAALESAESSLHGGLSAGAAVLKLAADATAHADGVGSDLVAAVRRLDGCVTSAGAMALDSEALVTATSEAVTRSAVATSVAQDATSRLDSMREGLQESVKRIKRVGEGTQEISAVADVFELLTEQMGVLAVNASLEAERAGEAGAGFRQVAREVRAIAARGDDALVKIYKNVQGVQSDARAAAEAVERTTSQVVAGANVGAVSHSLLAVIAPLAESMNAMAVELRHRSAETAGVVGEVARAALVANEGLGHVVSIVGAMRAPVSEASSVLRAGHDAIAGLKTAVSI